MVHMARIILEKADLTNSRDVQEFLERKATVTKIYLMHINAEDCKDLLETDICELILPQQR